MFAIALFKNVFVLLSLRSEGQKNVQNTEGGELLIKMS